MATEMDFMDFGRLLALLRTRVSCAAMQIEEEEAKASAEEKAEAKAEADAKAKAKKVKKMVHWPDDPTVEEVD